MTFAPGRMTAQIKNVPEIFSGTLFVTKTESGFAAEESLSAFSPD